MNREELEHGIRASASVTDRYEFIIVGSQSILGPEANPPEVFTMSVEADIYPLQAPELSSSTTASGPSPAVATTPDPASECAG
jgi:hypothetical protein